MNLERKGHRAQGIRRQVNKNTEQTLGVDHGRILWSDRESCIRVQGQANRALNMHITSKTGEHNNRACNVSIHQDKRYLNTSRHIRRCTIHPEYDLSEGNTTNQEISLRIHQKGTTLPPIPYSDPNPSPPHLTDPTPRTRIATFFLNSSFNVSVNNLYFLICQRWEGPKLNFYLPTLENHNFT